jgi:Xaa-Pro aminopeptidase
MKSDIDALMEEAGLDALLVTGPAAHNPHMNYFTGLIHLTDGYLLKRREKDPVLFFRSMEREEAARSGLETKNLDDYNFTELIEQAQGDRNTAIAIRLNRIFDEYGVMGRIGVYGRIEVGPAFAIYRIAARRNPRVEFVGEASTESVLSRARLTKDEGEVERIRKVGEITVSVVEDVANFLTAHQVEEGILVNRDGEPLTVGEIKRRVNLWLAMRGAENPEGIIFSLGRDAGIPHNAGEDDDLIRVGTPIIFDIFPCEAGGGYFFDFTRTWCLGYAPDDVQAVYDDVQDVYHEVYQALKPNVPCREFQIMTCERLEARGHPTICSDKRTEQGYVHGLAHGVGLNVHEAPWFRREGSDDLLLAGSVITVEPGLYYPERDLGVRIEDTVWVKPDGTVETLVEYPHDLVLPMPGLE